MMNRNELIKVDERIRKWKTLSDTIPSSVRDAIASSIHHTNKRSINTASNNSTYQQDGVGSSTKSVSDDPFDCSELIVPPTYELVQNKLKEYVEEWRELDSRVIITDPPIRRFGRKNSKVQKNENSEKSTDAQAVSAISTTDLLASNGDNQPSESMGKEVNVANKPNSKQSASDQPTSDGDFAASNNWIWNPNRIKLPDFFDYTCKGDPPQPPSSPTSSTDEGENQARHLRRKVISLNDPTKYLDYECELWKIFKEVPLASEIEKEAVEGHACVATMKIRNEIEEGMKEYSRMDAHALSRLRKRERHHWPRINVPSRNKRRTKEWTGLGDIQGATIRVECWRRQLKRGSGCDPNRCEVELLESQTLLDLHNVLVNCSQDDLFTYGRIKEEQSTVQNICSSANIESSGYFFIEDTFYTHGDVDYVTPIINWLNDEVTCEGKKGTTQYNSQKKKRKRASAMRRSRKEYLGIGHDVELKIVPMKEMKLRDLSFRLACRYVHVFNGDCQSAILFSDVSMRMSNENVKESQYPLVHDIFTTTTCVSTIQESATCQVCERGSALVMTLNDEMTDGGPTLFCALCYAKLHYNKDGTELLYNNFEVIPLTVLQNLRDLSVGNDSIDSLF